MNIGKECNHIKNVRKLFNKIYCIRSIDKKPKCKTGYQKRDYYSSASLFDMEFH